jgi:hypothetical protein
MSTERALTQDAVLEIVFSYLGPGHWLFATPVSELWKEWYEKLEPAPQGAQSKARRGNWQRDLNSIRMTSFEAAFQSAACVRLACEHGLQACFHKHLLQHQAGRVAGLAALMAAQELSLHVTDKFMNSAAYCGHIEVLELLRTQQVPHCLRHSACMLLQMHASMCCAGCSVLALVLMSPQL